MNLTIQVTLKPAQFSKDFRPVGSQVTCSPPPESSDHDYLALVSNLNYAKNFLESVGFDSEEYAKDIADDWDSKNPDQFLSMRSGKTNIILTDDEASFRRFMAATSVAARLNLLDKKDRIALFQAVLYGNACFSDDKILDSGDIPF